MASALRNIPLVGPIVGTSSGLALVGSVALYELFLADMIRPRIDAYVRNNVLRSGAHALSLVAVATTAAPMLQPVAAMVVGN